MSAKGNGAASVVADRYPTPPHMVTRLLEACDDVALAAAIGALDPCADEGLLLRTLRPGERHAIELRPECEAPLQALGLASVTIGDALKVAAPDVHLVITNPPFTIFESIARRFRSAPTLALLGRSSWLFGALDRAPLIREIGMPDVYGCPERPCFVRFVYRDEEGRTLASGGSDSVGCAWYVWHGLKRNVGEIRMLREATKAERAAHRPPTRVLVVRAADWASKKKKSPILREEWIP